MEEFYRYDALGRVVEKTDRDENVTSYVYRPDGKIERILYGDGRQAEFSYTSLGQISTIKDWLGATKIERNPQGKPERITDHNGQSICYQWGKFGERTQMVYPDGTVLCYHYGYDPLGRLIEVEKDGVLLRRYEYDSFGNRIGKTDFSRNLKNLYTYDSLNRLKEEEIIFQDTMLKKNYDYDRRGNLVGEYQENELCHGYQFGAINRLEKAWNGAGAEAEYFYNGIGQRTGRKDGDTEENYLLDLTKTYYNLLGVETSEKSQSFYWDYNVAAAGEEGSMLQYYLQDELGVLCAFCIPQERERHMGMTNLERICISRKRRRSLETVTAARENISLLAIRGIAMIMSAAHTLPRQGSFGRIWEGLRRRMW